MNTTIMKASIKKELWEFNGMLTWVPVTLAGVFIFIPLLGVILNGVDMKELMIGIENLAQFQSSDRISEVFFVSAIALFSPFIAIGFIVQVYYFVTCLFDERRDQSVMFWRSLPVSDKMTIASKVLTGAIVIPVIFFMAATLLMLFILVLAVIACSVLSIGFDISLWGMLAGADIISGVGYIWLTLVPIAIWLLPLYSWLMLASIYANKAPFLWAVLPIVALLVIEAIVVHYLHLSQPFFGHFLMDYFSMTPEHLADVSVDQDTSRSATLLMLVSQIDYRTVLISTGLLFTTYWFRVNKQES
ncbi:ABC transporter permease [Colwellia sp. Bg11-28]|uniref:ABC transporter permease n=1 Tax=Colwellia sp. Bg11-28 TaxID=2058305 RepID=UPI000C33D958|nr:ABC transporter permease [Colwellia sp. Bg11-28]PKH88937.1 ABC transporter permease [Colwellia sp. Bg11-28]